MFLMFKATTKTIRLNTLYKMKGLIQLRERMAVKDDNVLLFMEKDLHSTLKSVAAI